MNHNNNNSSRLHTTDMVYTTTTEINILPSESAVDNNNNNSVIMVEEDNIILTENNNNNHQNTHHTIHQLKIMIQNLMIFVWYLLLFVCVTYTSAMMVRQQFHNDVSEDRMKQIGTMLQNLNETAYQNQAMLNTLLLNVNIQNKINGNVMDGIKATYQMGVYTFGAVVESFDALDQLRNAFLMLLNLLQQQQRRADVYHPPTLGKDEYSKILQLLLSSPVKNGSVWQKNLNISMMMMSSFP